MQRHKGLSAKTVFLLASLIVLSIGIASCRIFMGGDYRMYEGAPLPIDRVAIIQPEGGKDTNLLLKKIDGVEGPGDLGWSSSFDGNFTIELLPGEHTLTLSFHLFTVNSSGISSMDSTEDKSVTFTAEPGKLYRISHALVIESHTWKPVATEVGPIPQGFVRPKKSP